jgi:hypothetical protein
MPVIPRTWTDQRPSARVCWLGCYNALRRWPLAASAFGLSLVAIGALADFSPVRLGMAAAASHPFAALAIASLLFAMLIYRRRRRLVRDRHRDWLAPLPNDVPLTARAAYAPFVMWGCAVFAVFTACATTRFPLGSAAALVFASAAGFGAAVAAVGLVAALERRVERRTKRARGRSRPVPPPSRYAVVHKPRGRWATRASLAPLGYWPMGQAKFSDRPKMRARSLYLLFLGLPLDVSGAVALAAAAVWLLTMHLVNLLLTVVRVAFAAAWWLAPTPVGAARFTVAVSHRALAGEIATCALLTFMAAGAGGPRAFHTALTSALIWTMAACLVSAAACLMALRSRSVARSVVHRWIR